MRKITHIFLLIATIAGTLSAQTGASHSILAEGAWHKIAIANSGIYQLTINDIPSLSGRPINSIALFGNCGGMLAESNRIDKPDDLQPISIWIDDKNNNGYFDGNDQLLFYAEGADVWRYNSARQQYEFQKNAYASFNYCYLNTSATSINHIQVHPSATSTHSDITTYTAVGTHHVDATNTHHSGRIWVGDSFTPSVSTRSYTLDMPTPESGSTVKLKVALASVSSANSRFTFAYHGGTQNYTYVPATPYRSAYESFTAGGSNDLSFTITYTPGEYQAVGYLDYIEANVTAPLTFTNGTMFIRNTQHIGDSGHARFIIANTPENLRVWDITDYNAVTELELTHVGSSAQFTASTEQERTFIAFNGNSSLTPVHIAPLENQDIHGVENPEYLIVTHPAYTEQAERLADLHRIHDGINVHVVTDVELYNEFSSGRQDPIAIRQALRLFWNRAEADNTLPHPKYLLLFGKGTYDNRNITQHNATTIVTYESETSFDDEGASYCSDDLLGYMHSNEQGLSTESLDVSIGRLPAKNTDEATLMVDKIERYLTRSDLTQTDNRGDWRNYVALLADDADPSQVGDTDFTVSSEYTARQIQARYPNINIDKIYADSYIQQSGAGGSFYPDVNNALQQRINYGCLLLNYVGHGSTEYIGTERYITLSDIDNYSNQHQLCFFVTSTCSYGKYDIMDDLSGAEALLLAQGAGIGVVAAARPISHIRTFNTNVCLNALDPRYTIGDALRLAKNTTSVSHSIALMGDPALHLSLPQNDIVVTNINNKPVADGVDDSAMVLSRVTIEGEIRNPQGNVMDNFDGEIFPIVFDRSVNTHTLSNDNEDAAVPFTQQKSILYKGREHVTQGHFSYSFIVPRDVAYQYDYARLSHYAKDGITDASGHYSHLMLGGFDTSINLSVTRPSVRLFLGDSTFRSGSITDANPTLFAILEDSIGINAVGSGLGHDIVATLDYNSNNSFILNDFYSADINNSNRGYVTYTLPNLDEGYHTLTLKAWNIYNYSDADTITFYVQDTTSPTLQQFFAYPNPATDFTTLRIEHNTPQQISSASIQIYSITGKIVAQLAPTSGSGYTLGPIRWDFRNLAGIILPRGIYIARAIVTYTSGEQKSITTKIVKAQ